MGRIKSLSLDKKGFKFTGTVMLKLWNGGIERVHMDSFTLTPEQLSLDLIKHSINDGGVGCQYMISANVHIYDVYGLNYTQYNRTIKLNTLQCQEACIKITT